MQYNSVIILSASYPAEDKEWLERQCENTHATGSGLSIFFLLNLTDGLKTLQWQLHFIPQSVKIFPRTFSITDHKYS